MLPICYILGPHTISMEVYRESLNLHLPVSSGPIDLAFGQVPNLQKTFLDEKKSYSDKIHPSSITVVWQEECGLWSWTELNSNFDSTLDQKLSFPES